MDSTELSSFNGRFIQVFAYARLGGLHYAHPLDLVVMLVRPPGLGFHTYYNVALKSKPKSSHAASPKPDPAVAIHVFGLMRHSLYPLVAVVVHPKIKLATL